MNTKNILGTVGKKIGMTRIFDSESKVIPCTVIQSKPCYVTQVRSLKNDGYVAVQLAYGELKTKNLKKPQAGHFAKAGVSPLSHLVEIRYPSDVDESSLPQVGSAVNFSEVFALGDYVDVTGTSKGKGFQGVVKRHGFGGVGSRTHGQHNRERAPGSVGASSFPSRVFKGTRMAGRMGCDRVLVSNLRVVACFPEKDVVLVSGAVPGPKGSFVVLEK